MRKINVESYFVTLPNGNTALFDVKRSLINILFYPGLERGLNYTLKAGRIVDKINKCKKYLYLEEDEYSLLKTSMEAFDDYNEYSIEMINRCLNTEEVNILDYVQGDEILNGPNDKRVT